MCDRVQLVINHRSQSVQGRAVPFAPRSQQRSDIRPVSSHPVGARAGRFSGFADNALNRCIRRTLFTDRRIIWGLAVVLTLLIVGTWLYQRNAPVRWARDQAQPKISRLAAESNYVGAFRLAREAERHIPSDPNLAKLWSEVSTEVSIESDPPDATVEINEYSGAEEQWIHIGKTPIKTRAPHGYFRWRISKPGFATTYTAQSTGPDLRIQLEPQGKIPPGMVRIPGRTFSTNLAGSAAWARLSTALLHRPIRGHQQGFQRIRRCRRVSEGEVLKHKFVKDGRALSFEEAVGELRDATGRPGPATWEGGRYPDGQENFPVAGVSWYEAAAFADFAEKVCRRSTTGTWRRSQPLGYTSFP